MPRDSIQAAADLLAMKQEGCTRVAEANDKTPYGAGIAQLVELEKGSYGVNVVSNTGIDPTAPNFRSYASTIKGQGADCFFFGGLTSTGGVQITKDVHAAIPNAKLFGPDGMCSTAWTQPSKGGVPASLDPLMHCTVATLDLPAYPGGKTFLAAYKAKYGSRQARSPYAIYGYEDMKLVLDTIASLGPKGNSKPSVLSALFSTKIRQLGARHLRVRQERRHDADVLRPLQGRIGRPAGVRQDAEADARHLAGTCPVYGGARRPPRRPLLRTHCEIGSARTVEASSLAKDARRRGASAGGRCVADVGRWGLIVALAALPIYYGVRDLTHGYQAGFVARSCGHPPRPHASRLQLRHGLSNGAIWALIAIGYTLVYGIIELINFAHGDVFMIGSFTRRDVGDARAGPGHGPARADRSDCS